MRFLVWQERPVHRLIVNTKIELGDRLTLSDAEGELFNVLLTDDEEGEMYPKSERTRKNEVYLDD